MMKLSPLLASLALVLSAGVLPAHADDDRDLSTTRLQRLDDDASKRNLTIKHARAIEIAKAQGLVTLREIDLEDHDEWQLEGSDAKGREIEVEISARDGTVMKMERD
ncbi:MAG: PepSY domain-containing protein [Burkholderiales bacterium]|nr:MAG: PepSY domain-containing protein [Burkholderiales bacterium]